MRSLQQSNISRSGVAKRWKRNVVVAGGETETARMEVSRPPIRETHKRPVLTKLNGFEIESYLFLDFDHIATKSIFSVTPRPTRLTRPSRARASAILSRKARSSLVCGLSISSPATNVSASLTPPSLLGTSALELRDVPRVLTPSLLEAL